MKLLSSLLMMLGVLLSVPAYAKTYRVWNHTDKKQFIAVQYTEEACVSEVAGIGSSGGCRQRGDQVLASGWYGIEPGLSIDFEMSGPGICIHMKELDRLQGGEHTRGGILGHPERAFKIITKKDPRTDYFSILAEVDRGGSKVRRNFFGRNQTEVGREAGEAFRAVFFFETLPAKCFRELDYAVIVRRQ